MATIVAALFVEKDGCYANLCDVDTWDKDRDARKYEGPHPVVAHPPCQLWGSLANVNYARWGGEHNKPGNDGGCFASALRSVNKYCGVLEHPASSKAWEAHRLMRPSGLGWTQSGLGWVAEVWQSAYGHKANKATWLYYRGEIEPFELNWERPIGSYQIGLDSRAKDNQKLKLGKREANATPLAFRDMLLDLARESKD